MATATGAVVPLAQLAASTARDPQFQIPATPVMNLSVPYAYVRDSLIVEGPHSRRVLSGAAARDVLPMLLRAMDGHSSWGEIAERTGLSDEQVLQVLNLLFMAGALEAGSDVPVGSSREHYVARMVDYTRFHPTRTLALNALDSSHVTIRAGEAIVGLLSASLAGVGISMARNGGGAAGDFVVINLDEHSSQDLRAMSSRYRAAGTPVLPFALGGEAFDLGPVAWPDFGPCLGCTAESLSGFARPSASQQIRAFGASAIAHELVNLIARVGNAQSATACIRVDMDRMTTSLSTVTPHLHCNVCGPGIVASDAPLSYEYETAVTFPPQRLVDPRRNQTHYEDSSARLTLEFREFAGAEICPLPPLGPGLGKLSMNGLSNSTLGEILAAAFGVRADASSAAGKVKRWAPTGGNLGSPQAFLQVVGVAGLQDALYAYRAPDHSLVRLAETDSSAADGVELVLTGEITRVAKKYGMFGYRVVSLDAGVATLHAALIAEAYGVDYVNRETWDEQSVLEQYSMIFRDQAITGVLSLRGAGR